jgi:hypothetical protein
MISAVVPGTVGCGQGIGAAVDGADGAVATPMPAPPEVAVAVGGKVAVGGEVAVGDDVQAAGLDPVVVPGDVVPPGVVLAPALEAPASANVARLGAIRWATRKRSLSSACGVS